MRAAAAAAAVLRRAPCGAGRSLSVAAAAAVRTYEYVVDHAGAVHLDTPGRLRTVATAYRDVKFLDGLYGGLRRRRDGRWAQRCAGEINFLRLDSGDEIADARLIAVFTALDADAAALAYGGSRAAPFDPAALRVCASSGRLYHALADSRLGPLGLVGAPVAHALAPRLALDDAGGCELAWRGGAYRVPPLDWDAA